MLPHKSPKRIDPPGPNSKLVTRGLNIVQINAIKLKVKLGYKHGSGDVELGPRETGNTNIKNLSVTSLRFTFITVIHSSFQPTDQILQNN